MSGKVTEQDGVGESIIEGIAIGSELLGPEKTDKNFPYFAAELAQLGLEFSYKTVVGDTVSSLLGVLDVALRRSDVLICTGGLGPTTDDVTRAAISHLTELPLVENDEALTLVRNYYTRRGIPLTHKARRQALLPAGSAMIENEAGPAQGILIEFRDKVIIALPGPPSENRPMFHRAVLPRLLGTRSRGESRTFTVAGISEAEIAEQMSRVIDPSSPIKLSVYPSPWEVKCSLFEPPSELGSTQNIAAVMEKTISAFGDNLASSQGESLEEVFSRLINERSLSVGVIEGGTGGALSMLITRAAGAASYFKGGIVAYCNAIKEHLCHISKETMDRAGAVSKEAAEMGAVMARSVLEADVGLYASCIAGPEEGSDLEPAGSIFVGCALEGWCESRQSAFSGDRESIRLCAARAAIDLARRALTSQGPHP